MGSKKRVMRSIVNLSTKLSFAALAVLLTAACSYANTLTEVQINAQDSGYGIVLKTDETAQMKKTVFSDDKMTIELKDVEASPELDTVYNNVTNVENVTIAPSSKNGIKITFKGEGISNSRVYFEKESSAPLTAANKPQGETISLNAPISSYTPVYNPDAFAAEEDAEYSQTSNPKLNEALTKMHITRSMLVKVKSYAKKAINKAKSGDINIMTVLGLIFIIAAFMFKPAKKASVSRNADREKSLSSILSQKTPQMEREIGLSRQMTDNMRLNNNTSPIKSGYGLKAYQQSQKNPYMSPSMPQSTNGISGIARRKPLASAPVKKQTMKNKPVEPRVSAPIKAKSPSLAAANTKQTRALSKQTPAESSDLDSMKFLESITKIYEKNGRSDLAKGLKDNLRKAQLTNHL